MIDELSKVSALDFNLYHAEKFGGSPVKGEKSLRPSNAKIAWVPQTLFDTVWVFYVFASEAKRLAWEETMPDNLKFLLDRTLVEEKDSNGNYWWHFAREVKK